MSITFIATTIVLVGWTIGVIAAFISIWKIHKRIMK